MNIYATPVTADSAVELALNIVRASVDVPETLDITAAVTRAERNHAEDPKNDIIPLLVVEILRQIPLS